MMSSQEFQELERKPVQEWTPAEREAYEADRDRQQRITETRRRVEAELKAKRAEEKRAQLWQWYREEGVEESFAVQRKLRAERAQKELRDAIRQATDPSTDDD